MHARAASPYLPLDIAPEIERKVERLLILAEQPEMKRPIAVATVLAALPRACARDAALCEEVRRYLSSSTRPVAVSYASLTVGDGSGSDTPLPNRHGMSSTSNYEAAAAARWQPNDLLVVSGGVLLYEGDVTPTGTVASFGKAFAQIDVGYRDRWWSPFQDSAMLISSEAATLPSVTLSNYVPLTRLKLRYEAFLGRLSESQNIGLGSGTTAGEPRLAGLHLSIEPFAGWTLGIGRLLQYGGGGRSDSLGDLVDAFFNPSEYDNTGTSEDFGNQAASFTTQLVLGDPLPVAIYFEYAGEDTSTLNNLRLGNSALSMGLAFPKIGDHLSMTFEVSEWQNAWYTHHIYGDGLRNDGRVLGHWGADRRVVGEEVGARSAFAQIGWDSLFNGEVEASYRQLDNEDYGSRYETARQIDARYSRRRGQSYIGGELTFGRDVFGDSYSRIGGFIRF